MEVSSRFTFDESVSALRQVVSFASDRNERRLIMEHVALYEYVTTARAQEPHYFYMYTNVLQILRFHLPFMPFQCQILRTMNVAPNQLHPNSWAFVRAFEIVCESLELVPTVGSFFCFSQVKNASSSSLVSLSSQPNQGRFILYASNFKNYRDTFVRFRGAEGFSELMFDASGKPLFPHYWTSAPRLIKGTLVGRLNEYERKVVQYLTHSGVMGSYDLITRELTPQSLGDYIGSMSGLTPEERMAFVKQARTDKAKAAAAAAKVDPLSQLVVEEKKTKVPKRKAEDDGGRVSMKVPGRRGVVVVDDEEEEEEHVSPLKKKPTRTKVGQATLTGGSNMADLASQEKEGTPIVCCGANPNVKGKGKKVSTPGFLSPELDSLALMDEIFERYDDPTTLKDVSAHDLGKRAMDNMIRGALLSYFIATHQELALLEAEKNTKSSDEGMAALTKEFSEERAKLEEKLKLAEEGLESEVAKAVKAKKDAWAKDKEALAGEINALKEKLASTTKERDVAAARAKKADELEGKVATLQSDLGAQYDEGFQYALAQVKIAFPEADPSILSQLDALTQIVNGKLVPCASPSS
ncbi:hypothetical protein TSUD_365870 [Trifolium subterraneum]|uniref:Transposase (putative) gypsy type domain-containing protein n=1 Tax=Trifolium subterraneum TaxID=3900 RepID=A0A2Z6NGM2_TRISU|nr:hypothetical protein TSUD_365870 [Trifolium subterraneum]